MRLVFAGTPEPAAVALARLLDSNHTVVGVITRPDARKGRGRSLHPSPVADLAQQHSIPTFKPATLKADTDDGQAIRHQLAELAPDCLPVVAYGNLITPDLLQIAAHGWINLHFSLLPAWRGAAPVQAAIYHGDDITGATTFRIEQGLDTGPILGTVTENISATDTADELLSRLAHSGAELLTTTMDGLEAGIIVPEAQAGQPTYAPKITKDDARINWHNPAVSIDRHIRAYTPAPGAWTMMGGERVKVGPVMLTEQLSGLAPGQVQVNKQGVCVGTGTQPVELGMVQVPGKRMMPARDWARGAHSLIEEGVVWL